MTELEMAVEALKRCVPRGAFERALHQVRQEVPASEQSTKQEDVIREVLLEVGMSPKMWGFQLAAKAVELVIEMPGAALHKGIYPEVARIRGTTATRVERNIRAAIEEMFYRAKPEVLEEFFGNSIDPNKGKVTNSLFLHAVAMVVKRRLVE